MKLIFIITFIVNALFTTPVSAKTDAQEASAKKMTAMTIFVDVTKFTRKNAAARKMTKSHNEFAAEGYELVSVAPYTENGDLEGFFVSYRRK